MKKGNNILIYLSVLLMLTVQSVAQENGRNRPQNGRRQFDRDEFFAKRNAFIVEKMALSAGETAVFIPLENELFKKRFELGRDCNKLEREIRSKKEKSADEFNKLLKCHEEVKDKRDRLDKEYLEKFKKTLSAEKILLYQKVEREFFDSFMRERN